MKYKQTRLFRTYLLLTILFFSLQGYGQKPTHPLFIGGMFVHAGYISNLRVDQSISGSVSGIGGKLAFFMGPNFRLGTEGYASTYNYSDATGFYKLGWGGLLAEYMLGNGKIAPVFGLTVGGGRIRDLYILEGEDGDRLPDNAIYQVYTVALIAPHISVEYALKENIRLTAKVDYLTSITRDAVAHFAEGPRFYLGFLFVR